MNTTDFIMLAIGSIVIQYAIIFFAIRNGIERERKKQDIQIKLLSLIARKAGATEIEIEMAEGL